jgi:transcriptional regulator GlxA family with amidase domain
VEKNFTGHNRAHREEAAAASALAAEVTTAQTKTVGIVVYDGVAMLDFASPMEAFRRAERDTREEAACYKPVLIGVGSKRVCTDAGVQLHASYTCETAPPLDTIVIPGGAGIRSLLILDSLSAWLHARVAFTRRLVAVRDGVYALAAARLLASRAVTTHWRYASQLAQQYPDIRVAIDAAVVCDGPFYTCSSANAAIELSISLIEADYGRRVALEVARELVSSLRPAGEISPASITAADCDPDPADRLADVPAWVAAHLRDNLTVDNLAARACLCPRHFSRRFKEVFHCTPADFVESVRLAEAKKRLVTTRNSIDSIATAVGFHSSDSFRRAFERHAGMGPREFRKVELSAKDAARHQRHAFAVHGGGR